MSAPITEGQVLAGKYRVERELGKGGMGMVVAAMHQQLQQRVAMKFLLPGATQETIHRFVREARAAVRLKSEHVARVTDVDTLEDGTPYMVMEYLEGIDLSQRIRQAGPLPIDEAVAYVLQACEAIAEAHAAGIVHRDIKPANLFLTTAADGSQMVKVLDFGIVKALVDAPGDATGPDGQPAMALTRTTAIVGSPLYMSPEQLRSARSVDPRADIWSMGVVLFQLLTGRLPFEATELVELITMVTLQPPTLPRSYRPDLPEELEAAILGCLRKPREERLQNIGELAQAIAPFASLEAQVSVPRILRTLGLTASTPSSGRPSMPFSSRPSFPAFAASGASTVPAGAAGYAGPTFPSSPPPAGASVPPPARASVPPSARASLPPGAVARTAQGTSGPASSLPPPPAGAAGQTAAAPAVRRGPAGLVVAIAVALVTMTGGVVVVSQLWARGAQQAEVSPEAKASLVAEVSPEAKASVEAEVPPEAKASPGADVSPAPEPATLPRAQNDLTLQVPEDAATPKETAAPPPPQRDLPRPSSPARVPPSNKAPSQPTSLPKAAVPASTSTVADTAPRRTNPLIILERNASTELHADPSGKGAP